MGENFMMRETIVNLTYYLSLALLVEKYEHEMIKLTDQWIIIFLKALATLPTFYVSKYFLFTEVSQHLYVVKVHVGKWSTKTKL